MSRIDDTLAKLLNDENLTIEEARGAMSEIMSGATSEIKLSSWLTALRMKGEVASEIAGCAEIMRENATPVACDDPAAVDIVGTGGDCAGTINISTMAALITAGAGVTVAKHGNKSVSSKSGSADVLTALGIDVSLTPERMAACLKEVGLAFLFAPALHPAMKHAMPVRRELGIRTVFNVLGPLSNPAGVSRLLIGVYSPELCDLIAEAARNMGVEHCLVVHGSDGLDEITLTGPTRIRELRDGEIRRYDLDPVELGLETVDGSELKGGGANENAVVVEKILSGELSGPKRDVSVLNAAGGILVSGQAKEWKEAITMASESIDSGAALGKLTALRAFTGSGK